MKPIGEVTALCIDHGLFLPVAHRLARDCKRVLYHSPWETGFSKIEKGIIGDGFPDIERCNDIWDVMPEVDLVVFPDIEHHGLQLELERQGKAVWGARKADSLELNREKFHKVLAEVGLEVPEFKVIVGITRLLRHLEKLTDKYIKISKWRGNMETFHWRDWDSDADRLYLLAVKFGLLRDQIPFLVFDPIESDMEIGSDTYCVDGQYPSLMLHGIEGKDKAYVSAVTKREDMPHQTQAVLEAFAPIFAAERYRQQVSTEIRVSGDDFYFIDPTCRGGMPSTCSQLALWSNWSEIVWRGAHGELVDPEPAAMFSAELAMKAKAPDGCWVSVEVPKPLEPWMNLSNCCQIDGVTCFPPDDDHTIGWLVATGNSPKEVLEAMHEHVEQLPDGVEVDMMALADVIATVHKEHDEGIEFTDKPVPEPAEAANL